MGGEGGDTMPSFPALSVSLRPPLPHLADRDEPRALVGAALSVGAPVEVDPTLARVADARPRVCRVGVGRADLGRDGRDDAGCGKRRKERGEVAC